MDDGPTAPLGELAEVAAERHGDVPFVADTPWASYGRPVRDFADLARAVHDHADRFWAAGIRAGDTVAVVQQNHIEVQALACALNRIGALPVLLSARIEPDELLECLSKLDHPYVAVDSAVLTRLERRQQPLRDLVKRALLLTPVDGAGADWVLPTEDRAAHQVTSRRDEDWALVTHTSGTTSVPKLAAHSTASLYGMVAAQIALSRKFRSTGQSAKHLSFVHARTTSIVMAFLEVAMPLLAIADPDPEHVRRLMLEHRPESVETHPNVYIQWEPIAAHPSRPFRTVRRFISTFDAMHPRTIRTLLDASDHPNAQYIQGYGQTETGAVTVRTVTRADVETYRPRNVGHPIPAAAVRVVDEAGEPVPDGVPGAIETQSPGRFRGYIGEPPDAADAPWWPMTDIGRIKPDGSLEILDRIVDHEEGTDSFLELEDRLLDEFPGLVEVVLLKSVDGAATVAVACPRAGAELDLERFRAVAAEAGLPGLEVQRWRWEDVPMTGSYKVRRGELRKLVGSRS